MAQSELVNTSTLSKLYRTTTGDIQKKLAVMGVKPVRTVIQQSGRQFKLWDEAEALRALEEYQKRRKDKQDERAKERAAITSRTFKVSAPESDEGVPSAFLSEDEEIPDEDDKKINRRILTELLNIGKRLARVEDKVFPAKK